MKRKLLSGILALALIQTIVFGQAETYTVDIAKFSSDIYNEFSPVFYKNGLVFCSDQNKGVFLKYFTSDGKGLLKIYYVDKTPQGTWKSIKPFSRDLKTRFNDGPASFSMMKDTLYFSRNLKVDGSLKENSNPRNKLGIFYAVDDGGRWAKTRDLRFNNEYYNITTPCISPDGKRLFFASDNPEGYGGSDLYYSQLKGDYWDDPVNLGPEINTPGNESYPFVDREGGLFFSSDGHPGLGGKDIFYTKSSGTKWLTPVRLDAPLNSEYDDFGFIADSVFSEGFFSSKRRSSLDIYHYITNIRQLFYCEPQRKNQYCFRFSDKGKITGDERFLQYVWTFGDGAKTVGQNVEHCFPGPGTYNVNLDIVDKKTGKVFFSKLSYNLDLRDIEQPVINSGLSAMAGEAVSFDGLASHFPGSTVLDYTWYFGDNNRTTGEKVSHVYLEKGDFEAKLGLIVRNNRTGVISQECVSKPVKIFSDKQEKSIWDARIVKPAPVPDILDYDHAIINKFISYESDYSQDMVFHVEVISSKIKLAADNSIFRSIPSKYTIKEVFLSKEKVYSYVVSEEMSLDATYPAFTEITDLGYKNARVRAFVPEDPASKELNNLKKVFGVSADSFFRKNDFNLASAGTQMLDLIIGFMSKYPALKLEISAHTDNIGVAAANQLLSQKRAEAMVNYLVINGVSPLRLVARGYGGTRPVASNMLETDRKLNRRIDFTIVRE